MILVKSQMAPLLFGIMKPPNRNMTIKEKRPTGAAREGFRTKDAIKRNSDIAT